MRGALGDRPPPEAREACVDARVSQRGGEEARHQVEAVLREDDAPGGQHGGIKPGEGTGQPVLQGSGARGQPRPHYPSVNQHVKVHPVWLSRVVPRTSALPDDGKCHFEDWVRAHHQRRPGGNRRVANHQEDGDPAQRESELVGTPITQEYLAEGPIDQCERNRTGGQGPAGSRKRLIARARGNDAERREHDGQHPAGEPVEAVDDVHGIRHSADGHRREKNRHGRERQQIVQAGHTGLGQGHPGHVPSHKATENGRQQPQADSDFLRQVLQQTRTERRKGCDEQGPQQLAHRFRCYAVPRHKACQSRKAADPRGGRRMKLLQADRGIQRQSPVPPRGHHQRQAKHERHEKGGCLNNRWLRHGRVQLG